MTAQKLVKYKDPKSIKTSNKHVDKLNKLLEDSKKIAEIKDEDTRMQSAFILGKVKEIEIDLIEFHKQYDWIDMMKKAKDATVKVTANIIKEIQSSEKKKLEKYLLEKAEETAVLQEKIEKKIEELEAETGVRPDIRLPQFNKSVRTNLVTVTSSLSMRLEFDDTHMKALLQLIITGSLPLDFVQVNLSAIKKYLKKNKDAYVVGVKKIPTVITKVM